MNEEEKKITLHNKTIQRHEEIFEKDTIRLRQLMADDERFEKFYQKLTSESDPIMERDRHEANREKKDNKRKSKILIISLIVLNVIWEALLIHFQNIDDETRKAFAIAVPWMSVVGYIVSYLFVFKKTEKEEKYRNDFKRGIVTSVIKEFSEELEYFPTDGLMREDFKEADIIYFNRYSSDNLIKGVYKNYPFSMARVSAYYDDGIENNAGLSFYGLVAESNVAKSIPTAIYIKSKVSARMVRNEEKENLTEVTKKIQIDMDSSEFEKRFEVFASDEVLGMQVLAADVMQLLTEFYEETQIPYDITLKGNKLFIALRPSNIRINV